MTCCRYRRHIICRHIFGNHRPGVLGSKWLLIACIRYFRRLLWSDYHHLTLALNIMQKTSHLCDNWVYRNAVTPDRWQWHLILPIVACDLTKNFNWFILSLLVMTPTFCGSISPNAMMCSLPYFLNTLRLGQNGRRFAYDTFKRIFLDENVRMSIKISLQFVPKGPINNNPALVQIMAWRRSGEKPFSEPMMVSLLTHICVTRPQLVKRVDRTIDVICHVILRTKLTVLSKTVKTIFFS